MPENLSGEFILNNTNTDEDKKDTIAGKTHKEKLTSPHFFSSFCRYPDYFRFIEQEKNEKVVLLLKRHFIVNLPWIVGSIFMAILPISFPYILNTLPFPLPSQGTLSLFLLFYYLAICGFVLLEFSLWYFHAGIITNQRLIDIDLSGVLYRHVSETRDENIEDVSYSQAGLLHSLFNYGSVDVQTAGTQANIEYDRVPRPSKVADIIGDLSHPV